MAERKIYGPVEMKNRQKMMAVAVFGGFLFIVMIALWVSEPEKKGGDYVAKRGTLQKDYRARPASGVTDEEHWILRSEEEIELLRRDSQAKDAKIDKLIERLEGIESSSQQGINRLAADSAAEIDRLDQQSAATKQELLAAQQQDRQAMEELNRLVQRGASEEEILALIKKNSARQRATPVKSQNAVLDQRLPPPPRPQTQPLSATRPVSVSAAQPGMPAAPGAQPATMQMVISLKQAESEKDKKKSELAKNISRYLPTGTLSKGVFLTGVDAPTGGQSQSNPHPVLIRIKSFGNLPNFAKSYLKDCHVLGAATGNISSERVEIRLETLTCILRDGGVIEVSVKGYVTGEDGKMGMRGRVVEKQGQLIARALVAGSISGVGSAIQQQNQTFSTSALGTTSSLDPDKVAESGLGQGVGTTMEKLADYYFNRLNEMYPVIEMDAGRICDIILTGGTDLKHKIVGNTYEPRG